MVDQNQLEKNFLSLISNVQKPRKQSDDGNGNRREKFSEGDGRSNKQGPKNHKEIGKRKYCGGYKKTNEYNRLDHGNKRSARENIVGCTNQNKKRKYFHSNLSDNKILIDDCDSNKNQQNKGFRNFQCKGDNPNSRKSSKSDDGNKNFIRECKNVRQENRNANIDDGRNLQISSNYNTRKGKKKMDYKSLENLLNSDAGVAVATLANSRSGFTEILHNRPLSPDLLMLIIKLLYKINGSEAYQLKMQVLSSAFQPEFIDELKQFVALVCVEDKRERLESMSIFFMNVLNVLGTVVNSFPSTINLKLKSTLNALNLSMTSVRDEHGIDVSDCLFNQLKELVDQVNNHLEHKNKVDKEEKLSNRTELLPPSDYREVPLIPTKEDFSTGNVFLRQNIVIGSYSSVDHYLDVQFRLLREDFIAPLREGIFEYIGSVSSFHLKHKYTNVRIYPKVKFVNSFNSGNIHGFNIQFDCERTLPRHINWEYSKRFMPGSLLLFSDNNFQTFYLCTVTGRNIKKMEEGFLFVTFVPGTDVPENLLNDGVFFVMAESEVYFEAYKHVLSALQRMDKNNFPMKKYIVDVDTASSPPAYLNQDTIYEISSFKVKLLDNCSWPSPEELKLNPSQHQALKSALTNDFSVIQGPPGTGKTFLALKITKILLLNEISHYNPIVVICYTNHALDQFLEGILKYTQRVIRIGMQSKNETLQKYNLEEIRKTTRDRDRNFIPSTLFRDRARNKYVIQGKLQTVKDKIEELSNPEGILDLSVLKSVVSPNKYDELEDLLYYWLYCFDNPELHTIKDSSESLVEMPSEKHTTQEHSEILFESASKIQDYEEEIDEEETTRRLADMKEDDYLDEDFFLKTNDDGRFKYSIECDKIKKNIETIYDRMRHYKHKNRQARFYHEKESKARIEELNWELNFLNKYLHRFRSFKLKPDKFAMLEKVRSVWDLNVDDRWEYYFTWVHMYICRLKQTVQHLTKEYQDIQMELHELRQLEDFRFVKDAAVVGLTTSGAAKRRVLLESLCTKIVIVEEAAEVLEAHIVTSLVRNVQHVILIGDHKQLKPKPAVFELAKKYKMDCSLFERMINNGLSCSVLNEQHRMRPEIASLITPTIYPHLDNHPTTLDRPKIRGIDKFVFFLTHNQPEDKLPDSSSKQNKHEADLLMALCQYLLHNEYKPEEITILATYTGQVWYMKKRRREMGLSDPNMRAVRITQVDSFQGEENRIILLSLVRSNKENKIGFLSTENRVCVALSRAKEGLYVVGNMDNLTNSSTIWQRIKQQLEAINAVGPKLILRCERHSDQLTLVAKAEDFKAVPEGGCSEMCGAQLDCGHICPRICHIIDKDHTSYKCKRKCTRRLCAVKEHKSICPRQCWEDCDRCIVRMEKQLPCGHTAHLRCHADPATKECIAEVTVAHPVCGHEISKPCFWNVTACSCTHPCTSRLPCGHACELGCHVDEDPDHLEYICYKKCAKEYKGCPRQEHPCPSPCYEECPPCRMPIETTLPCGHRREILCSDDPATVQCESPCRKVMTCGHECKLPCWVNCNPTLCTEVLFPVVFALMDRKIQTAYQGVYSWVREAIPAWAPRVILADFESAMRNAAQLTWHPQQMTGCWFHFAQAIFRMHSRLGMIRLTEENIEANWALHMLMALPLLPAERIVTGLAVVCHYVRVHNLENNFRALLGYLDNYWVRTVGVENFSVHGQTHRTNNALEGFYSNLVHVMGPHPGMWHFHDHLKRVELANWQDLQRLQNNVPHVRPRRRVYQRQDANIRDAQNRLELGQYTEAQFLHRMAHSTRSLAERTFRNQRAPAAPAAQALPAVPLMPPNLAPAGQQPAGPQAAGPQPAGPQPAGPQAAGPQPVGPQPAGPQAAGPHPAGPQAAGPQPVGPQPAGPQPVGPQPAGPQAAGPHPAGPQAAGTQPAGQQPVEPHPAEPQPAADPREPGTCTICLAEPAGRVAIPCGHYCVCPACVHILVERGEDTRCPFCRANIIGFFNVFTNL